MRTLSLLLRGRLASLAVLLALFGVLAPASGAAQRRVSLPAAFRPDNLNSITTSPSAPVAFTASRETDSVFAFDPRTGAMLGHVEVGDGPLFVRMREAGGRRTLAVSCDGQLSTPQNLIAIVDATDPSAMRVVERALVPRDYEFLLGYSAVLFSPDGSTLLTALTEQATGTAHGIFVTFDVATGRELGRVDIGFAPSSAELTVNNGRVIVAVSHATAPHGRVTVVDATNPAAPSVLSRVTLTDGSAMFNVNNVALSADGRTGYVCAATTGFLFTFDVETGALLAYDATGAFATAVHAFEQNGQPRLLVVAEESAAVFLWDVSDPRKPRQLASFYSGIAFIDSPAAITRDGKAAFITSSAGDQVIAIDLVEGRSTYNDIVGDYPVGAAVWEGDGAIFVCVLAANGNSVSVLESTSKGFRRRGVFDGAPGAVQFGIYQNVALNRDGRLAFVASTATDELLAIDVDAAKLVGRIPVADAPSQVAVGEDGSGRIRVAVLGSGDSRVSLVDATNPGAMVVMGAVGIDAPAPYLLQLANLVFSADASLLFVADGSQFVTAIDTTLVERVGVVATGFAPFRIALREEGGQRTLAVLNAAVESPGLAVIDATDPRAMRRRSYFQAPSGLVVALNNVPTYSPDGRFVVFGASISRKTYAVDVATGALVASLDGVSPLRAEIYSAGSALRLAAFGLGTETARFYRFAKNGGLKPAAQTAPLASSFLIASNLAHVSPDGQLGFVPDYGRGSLLFFNPGSGQYMGEIDLDAGPSDVAVDWVRGRAVVINANGTSGDIVIADLSDAGPIASKVSATKRGRRAATREARGIVTLRSASKSDARIQYFATGARRMQSWPGR